jgi:arylsulfatase A-like enzyme
MIERAVLAKNVIYLVADALRPDYLGCYGSEQVLTTEVDRLAANGVRFENVVTSAPWTVPSIATHLTGKYAHRLKVFSSDTDIGQDVSTIFQLFKRAGYQTAAFFDSHKLFQQWSGDVDFYARSLDLLSLLDFISKNKDRPFFLFNLYRGTHIPYVLKYSKQAWYRGLEEALDRLRTGDEAGVRESKYRYSRAVELFSEWYLRAILDRLETEGLRDNTAIILTSDHGESWGERFKDKSSIDVFSLHGPLLYNDTLQVPLIFHNLGTIRGSVVQEMVRSIDILPTLLEAMDIQPPSSVDGKSLHPCLNSREFVFPQQAFCSTTNYENPQEPGIKAVSKIALVKDGWKCILSLQESKLELYHLTVDPEEQEDLCSRLPERAARMRREIESEITRSDLTYEEEEERIILNRLEQLGYL